MERKKPLHIEEALLLVPEAISLFLVGMLKHTLKFGNSFIIPLCLIRALFPQLPVCFESFAVLSLVGIDFGKSCSNDSCSAGSFFLGPLGGRLFFCRQHGVF